MLLKPPQDQPKFSEVNIYGKHIYISAGNTGQLGLDWRPRSPINGGLQRAFSTPFLEKILPLPNPTSTMGKVEAEGKIFLSVGVRSKNRSPMETPIKGLPPIVHHYHIS